MDLHPYFSKAIADDKYFFKLAVLAPLVEGPSVLVSPSVLHDFAQEVALESLGFCVVSEALERNNQSLRGVAFNHVFCYNLSSRIAPKMFHSFGPFSMFQLSHSKPQVFEVDDPLSVTEAFGNQTFEGKVLLKGLVYFGEQSLPVGCLVIEHQPFALNRLESSTPPLLDSLPLLE